MALPILMNTPWSSSKILHLILLKERFSCPQWSNKFQGSRTGHLYMLPSGSIPGIHGLQDFFPSHNLKYMHYREILCAPQAVSLCAPQAVRNHTHRPWWLAYTCGRKKEKNFSHVTLWSFAWANHRGQCTCSALPAVHKKFLMHHKQARRWATSDFDLAT